MYGIAKKRLVVIATGVGLAILVTSALVAGWLWLSRDYRMLKGAVNEIGAPSSLQVVSDERGGSLFTAPPYVTRQYLGRGDPAATFAQIRNSLLHAHFHITEEHCPPPDENCFIRSQRGSVFVEMGTVKPGDLLRRDDASLIATIKEGEVGVWILARRGKN